MKDYLSLLEGLGLSERGLQIAQKVVLSEPVRRVKSTSRKQNKSVRFPSRKMNFVVQAESFTLEFASVLVKEHDNNVLGFWDQPPGVSISYRSGSRTIKNIPTLDYFVIGKEFVGFEEWKPFKELQKLASKRSEYAYFDPKLDRFISPAYERALKDTGLAFRFCTERDLPTIYVENLVSRPSTPKPRRPARSPFGRARSAVLPWSASTKTALRTMPTVFISACSRV